MNKQEAKKHIIGMLVSGREFCSSKDTREALLEYNEESCPHLTKLSMYTLFEKSESGIDAMRDALDEAISAIKGTDEEACDNQNEYPKIPDDITAKDGFLWRNGEIIPLQEANEIAASCGFVYAVDLVRHLKGES